MVARSHARCQFDGGVALKRTAPPTDLLLVVMGPPHQNELVTTLLRLVIAAMATSRTVQVWTCGYATLLTQSSLGEFKPADLLDRSRQDPTTATVIAELLAENVDRLYWYGCRSCGEQRGADRHIDGVRVRSPHRFADHARSAGKTVYLGTS